MNSSDGSSATTVSAATGTPSPRPERPRSADFYRGIRASIAWLHEEARAMNDPHAKSVLNNAAFHLGGDKPTFHFDDRLAKRAALVRVLMAHTRSVSHGRNIPSWVDFDGLADRILTWADGALGRQDETADDATRSEAQRRDEHSTPSKDSPHG
jgi:hypothetical protein